MYRRSIRTILCVIKRDYKHFAYQIFTLMLFHIIIFLLLIQYFIDELGPFLSIYTHYIIYEEKSFHADLPRITLFFVSALTMGVVSAYYK